MGKIELTGFLSGLTFFLTLLGLSKTECLFVLVSIVVYSLIGIILALTFPAYFYQKGILSLKEAEYLAVILSMVWIFYVFELFSLIRKVKR